MMITMMTINVAADDGADTDDDNNYKLQMEPPKENSYSKRLDPSMIAQN